MFGDDASDLESKFNSWSATVVDILSRKTSHGIDIETPRSSEASLRTDRDSVSVQSESAGGGAKGKGVKVASTKNLRPKKKGAGGMSSGAEVKAAATGGQTDASDGCCSSTADASQSGSCCNSTSLADDAASTVDEEEEEDRINSHYVTMDTLSDDEGEGMLLS